jgi:hypothetical protein
MGIEERIFLFPELTARMQSTAPKNISFTDPEFLTFRRAPLSVP